nr:PilZ domain-containing protein [Thiocystis violacea]
MDYIRQLFADSGPESEPEANDEVGGWLRVSEDAAGLLEAFSESPRIELQAGWKGHRLRFPLKPRMRVDSGEMTLEIGVPEILEGGDKSRGWRASPGSDEMRILDQSGRLEPSRVVNLSYTGMAIEQRADRLPDVSQPLKDLCLVLPGEREFVRLLGYVVRHTQVDEERVQLGIRFEPLEEDARDLLGRYILRRHKELQEEAQ